MQGNPWVHIKSKKKKKSWNYTHFIWHSVSLSWCAFHTISNQRNSQTADVKDPWLLVWSPWKDQKDLGLVYQQLSSLQLRLNGLDGIPGCGKSSSILAAYRSCCWRCSEQHPELFGLHKAGLFCCLEPCRVLESYSSYPAMITSSVPLTLQAKETMWFCTTFLPFSIKGSKCSIKLFFSTVFPSFLSLSLLYFFRLFCFSGNAHSFIINVPTRIWSKTIVSELQLYCTQDL